MKDIEISIEKTKLCILESLQQDRCVFSNSSRLISVDFITKKSLERPPFHFVHSLITIYVQHLSFAEGLYDNPDFSLKNVKTRQHKIRFIFRMLLCVAKLTQERVDIYVSPVKLLSGQDVFATHNFLRCLAKASRFSCDESATVAAEVMKSGESILYQRSVKTRNAITKLQAVVRGKYTRRKMKEGNFKYCADAVYFSTKKLKHCTTVGVYQDVLEFLKFDLGPGMIMDSLSEPISPDTSDDEDENYPSSRIAKVTGSKEEGIRLKCRPTLNQPRTDKKCASKEDIKKVGRSDQYKKNDSSSNLQSGRKQPPRTKAHVAHTSNFKKEQEIDTGETHNQHGETLHRSKVIKKQKKCKIVNGIVARQELEVLVQSEERQKMEEDKKLKTIDEIEAELKRKTKRLKVREAELDDRLEETKQKEEYIHLHEDRVKRLAESLRKQQTKLKQEGIKQSLEMDKLRLETSCRLSENRHSTDNEGKNIEHFSEELLRQACNNRTITDLRLALERKGRSLSKRQERIARAEKELRQRIVEFEESKKVRIAQELEDKKSIQITGPIPASIRTCNSNSKIKKNHDPRQVKIGKEPHTPTSAPILGLSNETLRRRQAFVPATLPQELQMASAASFTGELGSERPPVALLTIPNHDLLTTIVEERELKRKSPMRTKKSLPRSLVNYTNHRNENSRQRTESLEK